MKRIVSLALILCLFLTGCGQVVKTKSDKASDVQYVYRSESCSVKGMDGGFAYGLAKADTWLCAAMVMTDWESGRNKSWIACYHAKTGITQRIEPDVEEGTVLLEIAAGENGEFWGISCWLELGGDVKLSVNRYAKNGKILASNDLTALLGQDGAWAIYWLYGNCLQIDQDGNLYLAYKDVENPSNSVLLSFSPEGQILFHTGVEGTVQRLTLADNGQLYMAVKHRDDTMEILTADTVSGETETLIKDLPQNEFNTILAVSRDGKKLYYNVSGYLYEYDVAEGKNSGLFALSDVPLFEEELVGMVQTDADHFYFLSNTADENGISEGEWICVRRLRADQAKPIQDREVLTLAMFEEDVDVTQAVASFNRQSDTHKIEIRLYGGLSETDGAAQLQADIASGKIPDIIDLAGVDGMAYIRQGIVTDLTPFLEESSEISEEDFVEKAISTYRDGEGLYAIPTNFWIDSMVGKTSCLGERSGWTLEEFLEFADALPNPGAATASDSKEKMLDWMMRQSAERYIDWESGTCSFDSEEFLELLDFVNRFPDEVTGDAEQTVELARSEELMLYPITIDCVAAFQLNRTLFDDEVTYIGFPSESGSGTKMMIYKNAFGISQNCKDKEAAWEFLETMYTREANISGGFPVYKPSLEEAFAYASTGVYHTDKNGVRTERTKYHIYYGDVTFEIYAATDEEIRQIRSLIENAEPADIRTPGIYTIMQEEAEAFFAGQRSARETAEAMQGRVELYINEHR